MYLEGKRREINNPCGFHAFGMNLRTGFVAAGEVSPASLPGLPLLLTLQGSLPVRLTSEPCPWSSLASKLMWRRKLDKWGYVRGWPCLSFEISSQNVLDTLSQHPQRHRWVYIKLSAALSPWTKVPHSSPFSLSYRSDNAISWSRFFKELAWNTSSTFCGKRLVFISQQM